MFGMSGRPKIIVSPRGRSALRRAYTARRSQGFKPLLPPKRLCSGLGIGTPRLARSIEAMNQRSNINVVVRVRPFAKHETPLQKTVEVVDEQLIVFDPKQTEIDFYFHGMKQKNVNQTKRGNRDVKFVFDRVYDASASNAVIYEATIKPTIEHILQGYNCSVFAYGATGSGKTYTMLGSEGNPGLTFLTVMELYKRLEELSEENLTEISASYLEVYNETVRDLLGPTLGPLSVCEDAQGLNIKDLSSHRPRGPEELLSMLEFGNKRRSQHPTDHNAESSRSHAVFQVMVSLRSRFTDLNNNYRSAKLVMVDLAGSERGAATGCKGTRFREGANINKSLLSLGNCINSLADGKRHIPYRDSKLTRILKDALGGNCKTVMIANVSPANTQYDDTYNTLRYADRAKSIRVQATRNLLTVHARIAQYGQIVEEMNGKIESLTAELEKANEKLNDPAYVRFLAYEAACNQAMHDSVDSPSTPRPPSLTRLLSGPELAQAPAEGVVEAEAAMEELRRTEGAYWEAMSAVRETDWRLKSRELRLDSALRVELKDPTLLKGIERMKRQTETMRGRSGVLSKKSAELKTRLEEGSAKVNDLMTSASPHLNAYLRVRGVEIENEMLKMRFSLGERHCSILFEEGLKTEVILAKGMRLLKPLYQIVRHHGQTTAKHTANYDEVLGEFLGIRLQWAEDGNLNETFSVSTTTGTRPYSPT